MTIAGMGALTRRLAATEAREGVLDIAFRIAEGLGHPLVNLTDPRAVLTAMTENTQDLLPAYPNAELEVMPNAGPYPIDETPVALATSIERFLGV